MAISVPLAIVLGLVASFVQSLGLTMQRKSYLENETLPTSQRRSEWRRKLWLVGFAIFISANVGGTVFQIGALPIVMLAPLGAVSLLFNAVLATFILDDFLSSHMVGGTLLIAAGAVLIGYFGVVQEDPHSLDDLLALYARPAFIAFASCFALAFCAVLLVAHLTEWRLNARLAKQAPNKRRRRKKSTRLQRRWSAPTLAPVAEVSESASGIATPIIAVVEEAARRAVVVGSLANADERRHLLLSSRRAGHKKDYGALQNSVRQRNASDIEALAAPIDTTIDKATHRTRLGLAVAFSGASGTLSGVCLLLAKSGIELLVLTFSGNNQFSRWPSWALVLVMLAAALLQLWYLNKSLKLVDPTLVCPLAFCFYNTSSIVLGLVYFNQLGALPTLNILAVVSGTAVLLVGVWLVSMHGHSKEELLEPEERIEPETDEASGLLANAAGIGGPHLPPVSSVDATPPTSPNTVRVARSRSGSLRGGFGLAVPFSPDSTCTSCSDEADTTCSSSASLEEESTRRTLYSTLLERGLQIGISVSSPGFQIQGFAGATPQSPRRPPNSPADARRARRALSEGDALIAEEAREVVVEEAGAVDTHAPVVLDEESESVQQSATDPTSSAWGSVIRGVDTAALTARLARLDPRRRSVAASTEPHQPGATRWWSWGRRVDQS